VRGTRAALGRSGGFGQRFLVAFRENLRLSVFSRWRRAIFFGRFVFGRSSVLNAGGRIVMAIFVAQRIVKKCLRYQHSGRERKL